jgi:hypothetical protein
MAKSILRHLYTSDRIFFRQGVNIFKKNFLKDKMRRFFKHSTVMPDSKVAYAEDDDIVKCLNTH